MIDTQSRGALAIVSLLAALVLAPTPPATAASKASRAAAEALHSRGDLAQARKLAQRALAKDANDGLGHEVAALLDELEGDLDGAYDHWLSAASDPDYGAAGLALARTLDFWTGRDRWTRLAEVSDAILADRDRSADLRAVALRTGMEAHWRSGRVERARALRDQAGFVSKWQTVAGFENEQMKGFDVAYGPEARIDLEEKFPGQVREVGWRAIDLVDRMGRVPHIQLQTPNKWSVGYLVTWVKSPKKTTAQLRLTTAEPLKAWLNDALVANERYVERERADQLVIPVKLHEGWNKLLVKSCQDTGDWHTAVRLTDRRGRPLKGLTVSNEPQRFKRAKTKDDTFDLATDVLQGHRRATPEARRLFLGAFDLYHHGLFKDAADVLDALAKRESPHPNGQLLGGHVAIRLREEEKALARYEAGAKIWPDALRFRASRAAYFLDRDRLDRAEQDIDPILEAQPDNAEAMRLQARLFSERGWQDERCDIMAKLAATEADNPGPLHELAQCARDKGRHLEMVEYYRKALELEPTDVDAIDEIAGYMLWRDQFGEAEALWKKGLEFYPHRTQPYTELGEIYRRARRWKDAEAMLEKATAMDPDYAYPYRELGEIRLEQDDLEGALVWWRQSLDRNPDNHSLWERVEHHEEAESAPYAGLIPTDEAIESALAAGAGVAVAQGANHVLLLDDEITVVNADGSARRFVTLVVRIVDEQGRDQHSSMSMPGGGRVRVMKAYSVDPDGTRHEVSSLRRRRARFQDLQPGSSIVLQYRHDQGRSRFLQNHWSSTWRFQQFGGQVHQARWAVMLPKERELAIFTRGGVESDVQVTDAHRIYSWTAKNVAPLLPEPSSPPADDLLWSVEVSTVPGWDFIAAWEWTMVEDALRTSPDVPELAKRLVPSGASAQEAVDAIYRYAARDIRYEQDYAEPIEGVRPHQCSVTVERGYGDCKDKTVVMMSLLRAVGVEARFAMISTATAGNAIVEVPSQQFNHAIVYVPEQDGIAKARFYDPTAETLDLGNIRWDDQGQTALVLWEDGWEFIEVPFDSPEMERVVIDLNIELPADPEELATATMTLQGRGRMASNLRRSLRNDESARKLVEGFGNGFLFVGANLDRYEADGVDDITKPLKLSATYRVPNLVVPDGDVLRFQLDEYLRYALQHARWPKRNHPMMLGPPSVTSLNLSFRAPEGYEVSQILDGKRIEEPCLAFELETNVEGSDVGNVNYTVTRKCATIQPEAYLSYRDAIVSMTRVFQQKPALSPKSARK